MDAADARALDRFWAGAPSATPHGPASGGRGSSGTDLSVAESKGAAGHGCGGRSTICRRYWCACPNAGRLGRWGLACRVAVPMNATETALPGLGYARHYNRHRPHQARGKLPPLAQEHPGPVTDLTTHRLLRTRVLGDVVNEYRYPA